MATIYKSTVSDVLQIVSDKRGESSLNTDASRIRSLSRSEQDLALRRFWRLFLLTDQTLTGDGSSTSYTIGSASYPMRRKGLSELFVGGTTEAYRYQIVDHTEYKNIVSRNSSSKVCYEWYDVANDVWKVKINPVVDNGTTIYYSYFWVPPDRTSASDEVVCVEMNALAYLTLAGIYEGEEEDQKVLSSLQKAEQIIGDNEGVEEAPAVGQIYRVGAIQNSITNRPIGSY